MMGKVLFVINRYPVSSETFIFDQIEFFRKKGIHVSVLCHSFKETIEGVYFEETNLETSFRNRLRYSLPMLFKRGRIRLLNIAKYGRNSLNQSLLLTSRHFGKNNDYDLIYCHYGKNGKIISQLKDAGLINNKTKIVTHFHGVDLNLKHHSKSFYRVLNKYSDTIVVGSNLAIEHLKHLEIYAQEKVIKVPVSLDMDKFPLSNKKKNNNLQIVTVGRLIELKGHLDAIEVIKEYKERGFTTFEYKIIGDGDLKRRLQNKIEEYNLVNEVKLLGALNHKKTLDILEGSDVYLYCGKKDKDGKQEMQGLAVIEAMASGCAVITSSIGGVKEYVTEQNGFVCTPGDISCFVDELIVATTDNVRVAEIRKNAYNTANEHFNREKNYKRLFEKIF